MVQYDIPRGKLDQKSYGEIRLQIIFCMTQTVPFLALIQIVRGFIIQPRVVLDISTPTHAAWILALVGIVCDPAKVSLRMFNVYDHSGLNGRRGLGFIIKTKFGKARGAIFPL